MAAWDVVVIGGGPAGLSAATTAASAGLSCLVLDRMGGGGELMNLGKLEEMDSAPTGADVLAQLLDQAVTAGAELGFAKVTGLTADATGWQIITDDGTHMARAVILAVGLAPGRLGIADEATFEGRGISYCAACDGPVYRGQPVLVAGADRWAIAEAHELSSIASHVTLVTQGGMPPATDAGFVVQPGRIIALEGDAGLEAVRVQPDGGGAELRLRAPVLFVQTGRRPALDFAPPALIRDPDGRLVTDAAGQCGPPGLFAAGDVCAGASRTIAAAIADGRRAAIAARDKLSPLPPLASKPVRSEIGRVRGEDTPCASLIPALASRRRAKARPRPSLSTGRVTPSSCFPTTSPTPRNCCRGARSPLRRPVCGQYRLYRQGQRQPAGAAGDDQRNHPQIPHRAARAG